MLHFLSSMAASYDPEMSCRREYVDELLERLSTQFLEMVPIRKMKWKDEETAALVATPLLQHRVLQATVLHPLCRLYPPSLSYRTSFMKQLIHKLEQLDAEVCDEVYETYTDLLSQREEEDEMLCFKTYTLPGGERVSLQESVMLVSEGTTGLSTWQAAEHLAEWVLENSDIFSDKHVVELGCGLGLTGLVVCRACKVSSYTFSDCHHQVLYLLAKNIENNMVTMQASQHFGIDTGSALDKKMMRKIRRQLSLTTDKSDVVYPDDKFSVLEGKGDFVQDMLSPTKSSVIGLEEEDELSVNENDNSHNVNNFGLEVNSTHWDLDNKQECAVLRKDQRIRVHCLDWERLPHQELDRLQADIVLAADVVYDTAVIPSLVRLLRQLLETKCSGGANKKAFIASTVRNEDTRDAFLIALSSEGLCYSVEEGPKKSHFHYDRMVPVEILKITLQ